MGTVQSHPCEDVEHFTTQPAGSAVRDPAGNSHKVLYRILKQDDDDIVCRPLETCTATKCETSPVKPTGVRVSLVAELCSVPNDSLPIPHDVNDYYLFANRQDSPVSSDDSGSQPSAPTSRQHSLSESSVMTVSDKPAKSAVDDRSLPGSPCKSPQQPPPHPATSSTAMHAIYVDLFKTTEERMRDLLEQRAKQRLQQAAQQSSNFNTDSSHANHRATNPTTPIAQKSPYDDRVTAQTPRGNSRTTGSMLPMLLGDGVESPSQRRNPLSSFDGNCSNKDSGSVVRRILGETASTCVSNSAIHQQQQRLGNEVNQLSSSSTSTKGLPVMVETSSSLVTNIYPWQRDTKPSTVSQQRVTETAVLDDVSRLSETLSSSISDIPLDLSAKHDDCVSTQSLANIPVSSKSHSSSQHHQAIDLASVAAKLSAHLAMTTESSRLSSSSSSAPKRSSLSELVALPAESRRQMLDSLLSSNFASSAAPASLPSRHQLPATTEAERGRTGSSTTSHILAGNLPNSQGANCSNSNEIAAAAEEEEIKKELPSHQNHIFRSTAIRRGGLSYYPEAGVGKKSTYHQRIFTANSASLAAKQKQQQPPSSNPQQRQQPQTGGLGESRNANNAAATSSSSSGLAHRSNPNVSVLRQLSPNGARALQALQSAAAAQPTQKDEEALKRMSGTGDDLATLLGGGAVGQRSLQVTETVVATVQHAGGASNSLAAATASKNLPPHPYQQQQQQLLQLPRESGIRAILQQKLTAVNASKTTSNERGRNDGLTLRERLSVATDKDLTLISNKSATVGQQQGTPQPLQQQRVTLTDGKNRLASLLSSPSAQVVELDRTSSTSSINQLRDSMSAATNNAAAAAAANNRKPLVANSNGQTSQSTTALQGAATPIAVNVSKPTMTTSSVERKTSNSSLRRLGVTDRFTPKPSTTPLSKTSISHSHVSSVSTSTVTSSSVTSPTRTDSAAASSSAVPLKRRWLASATNDMDDVCGDSDGSVAATKRSRSRSASLSGDGQQAEPSCVPS